MTVPVQTPITTTVATGSTNEFPFGFLCLFDYDLAVLLDGVAVDPGTYDVTGLGDPNGGTVTLATNPAAGVVVTTLLQVVLNRTKDYQTLGDLFAKTLNPDIDRIWLALQSTSAKLSRALLLGLGDVDGEGAYRANNNRIQDLGDPIYLHDAVSMEWVQTKLAEIADNGAGQALIDLLADGVHPLWGVGMVAGAARVVENIAALRALPVAGSKSVIVKGYYAAGDGGGGTYHLDATDTASPDNAGSIIVATDGGRWKLQHGGRVTAEQFGAKGDWNGTTGTDDTAAFAGINAHLTAFGGGHIVMRRRYRVPSGWVIASGNVVIDGEGSGEIFSLGTVEHAVRANSVSNITILGLRSSIPRTNLRSGTMNFFFQSCNYVTLEGCHTDGGSAGIWTYTCTDVLVRGCIVDTPKADGIHFGQGSSSCKAIGNTVKNSGDDAFSTTWYDGTPRPSDIVFANNIVEGTIWGAGVAVYSADNVTITGNQIKNTALYGVVVTNNAGGTNPSGVIVEGNNIHGACQAEKQPNSYWDGTDPADDPDITSSLQKSGMSIQGGFIKVHGNHVSVVTSLPNGLARTGLSLNGGGNISITGNTFNAVNGDGINTGSQSISQLTISGNNFQQCLGVGIRAISPLTVAAEFTHNSFGYAGASGTGQDFTVMLRNAGTTRVAIVGNVSSAGRTVSVDGTSTNVLNMYNAQ